MTATWFETDAQRHFEAILPVLLPAEGPRTLLQIGVWAGDATQWLLEHVLRADDTLYDVDPFLGTPGEHSHAEASAAHDRYAAMLDSHSPLLGRVKTAMLDSDEFYRRMRGLLRDVDFAYIDGDHSYAQVAKDVENTWPLIKPGGVMACDDFQWFSPGREYNRPKPALMGFLEAHQGEYDILVEDYQLWLRKHGG